MKLDAELINIPVDFGALRFVLFQLPPEFGHAVVRLGRTSARRALYRTLEESVERDALLMPLCATSPKPNM